MNRNSKKAFILFLLGMILLRDKRQETRDKRQETIR